MAKKKIIKKKPEPKEEAPQPETYLNQDVWEDELVSPLLKSKHDEEE